MHCRQLAKSKSDNAPENNSGESYTICSEIQSTHELGQTLTDDSRLAASLMGGGCQQLTILRQPSRGCWEVVLSWEIS